MIQREILSRPGKYQNNDDGLPKQAYPESWQTESAVRQEFDRPCRDQARAGRENAMDRAMAEHEAEMTPDQKRRAKTQEELAKSENVLSQLADRLETNSFQG